MGKYKKYAKTDQNNEQTNKNLPNDLTNNNNHINKIENNDAEFNNKNNLSNTKNKNNLKKEENSVDIILWEIIEAAKYFFIMCKNFLIPNGIPFKIFASFLILEILYQGITIYLIKSVNRLLEELFSIWNDFIHIYIYIVSNIQMIYIFICEGLLIFRFIHLKIFLYNKVNLWLNILSLIIIIFNIFEIKDLNYKVHRFYANNIDNFAEKNNLIKENIITEYINVHVSKNEDFETYETCYELKTDKDIINQLNERFPNIKWTYNAYSNIYTGCLNLPFKNDSNSTSLFFNCENKIDVNTAPNVCVSSHYRQQRFNAQIRMALFEILILILWNLYNSFSIKIIYKYYPNLKSEKAKYSEYENYPRKNQNNHNNKYGNQTVTFKDINDKEINNGDNYEEEEEEDENEVEEEDDDTNVKKEEKNQKDELVKVFKMRKISKRKMKTYKKKKKKRYKDDNTKNKNVYFDDEILNFDYFDNKFENQEDSYNNEDEKEDIFMLQNNNLDNNSNTNKNLDNKIKEKNDDESDSSEEEDDNENDENENDNDNSDENDSNDEEDDDEYNYFEQVSIINSLKKDIFENIEKFQFGRRLWKYLFDRPIKKIKNKIRSIFLTLDKNNRKKKLK